MSGTETQRALFKRHHDKILIKMHHSSATGECQRTHTVSHRETETQMHVYKRAQRVAQQQRLCDRNSERHANFETNAQIHRDTHMQARIRWLLFPSLSLPSYPCVCVCLLKTRWRSHHHPLAVIIFAVLLSLAGAGVCVAASLLLLRCRDILRQRELPLPLVSLTLSHTLCAEQWRSCNQRNVLQCL